ncbi:2-oxoglutarate-dependent dioxygenase 21, chloroplastic-like [Lolium rigidum]|uniref:2-oxoglutarate-dependent dioxygenase 21, chloroplastic-like n=1 Tax=Lolium rigidum TaxID=89674 RepID=UPI001F5DFDF8|nr:2-oxoglutarate-dependent dioxygenase 21, chloroplastic-like [Lolium rigidum]
MASHQPQQALPVINIALLGDKDPAARALVVQDIARACLDRGCFQVINHGVSKIVMDGALEAASEFFDMSTRYKEVHASDDIRSPVRYDTTSRDGISKSRSFLKHYANPLDDWINLWPMQPATYREKMGTYSMEIQSLSVQLMGAIVQGLGLGSMYLHDKLGEGLQFVALNNYPQGSSLAGDTVGLAPHSDYGFITILLQSSPGLEVMHHDDHAWTPVPAIPGALHVHLGDHLEVLSNGRLRSLMHRAILNTDEARISIASIHGVAMDENVECAEELVDEGHPKMYRESSFRDYLDFLPTNVKKYRRFVQTLKINTAA